MLVDCHTIHMFSINIVSWGSKNILQNCTDGERGKLIIAFWFEILVTRNMVVQLLIWYSLAMPICFMLQAQTCLLNHSLIVRNARHRCAKISRLVPHSPDTHPWDALGDGLTSLQLSPATLHHPSAVPVSICLWRQSPSACDLFTVC